MVVRKDRFVLSDRPFVYLSVNIVIVMTIVNDSNNVALDLSRRRLLRQQGLATTTTTITSTATAATPQFMLAGTPQFMFAGLN